MSAPSDGKPRIILYGSTGCPYCAKMKKMFPEWGFQFEERNVTENPEYFKDLESQGMFGVPVVFIDDKPFVGFRPNAMRKALGVKAEETMTPKRPPEEPEGIMDPITPQLFEEVFDFIVIGGGPAGASAALYAARAQLNTLVLDKAPTSGTLAITHKIANYPGIEEEVTGLELLQRMQRQAKAFGARFVRAQVVSLGTRDDLDEPVTVKIGEGDLRAKSVFIGVGAKGRASKIKGEEEYLGRGVSYCTTCDAAFFRDKHVAVVGQTGEAVEEALTLGKFASRVDLLVPGKKLSDEGAVFLAQLEEAPNIHVYYRHRVQEVKGNKHLEALVVEDNQGQENDWPVDGVFLYLAGTTPGTDFLEGIVELEPDGYVKVSEENETSIPGVFAGGDARRTPINQAVVSAADGAIAGMAADRFVNRRRIIRPQYS